MRNPEKTITTTTLTLQEVQAQKQVILDDFISAMPLAKLRSDFKEMYLASMASPTTEDQTTRGDITFAYRVIDGFLENLLPHCRYPDHKA